MKLETFRRTRRATSTALAAVFMVVTMLVCVPVPAAAAADHCAPPTGAVAKGHCDMPPAAMDCCAAPEQSPSVPSPQTIARTDAAAAAVHAPAGDLPQAGPVPCAPAFRDAPIHGHRHVDLPTLNATFLI